MSSPDILAGKKNSISGQKQRNHKRAKEGKQKALTCLCPFLKFKSAFPRKQQWFVRGTFFEDLIPENLTLCNKEILFRQTVSHHFRSEDDAEHPPGSRISEKHHIEARNARVYRRTNERRRDSDTRRSGMHKGDRMCVQQRGHVFPVQEPRVT